MSHSPALDPNINGSDPSPWGEVVDDDAWLKLLEARGLNQGVDDEPAALPVGIVTPTSNSPATTLPIHLDPTPRLVSDYLSGKIEAETVSEVKAVPHLEYAGDWWQGENLKTVQKKFRKPVFSQVAPNEEFLVGQDRTIRVFSFGRPLSVERQQDLERFVDIATQFMGDRVYDFISDVVIGEFANNTSHKDAKKDEDEFAGFAFPGNGVVLVNSSILRDDAPVDKGAEGSLFLQTLLHEFGGHLLHGDIRNDPQAREDLEEFAAAVGWRMEEMRENGHDWTAKGADNKPYAPFYATPHTIFMPAGGSPTEYGTANPMETAGETSKHMMLGSKVMDMMTETDSAWFAYLQKRLLKPGEVMGDQPIATPLERKPITITRYTGTDIRYPQSEPLSISTL